MALEILDPVVAIAEGRVLDLREDPRPTGAGPLEVPVHVVDVGVHAVDDERRLRPARRRLAALAMRLRALVVRARAPEHHRAVAEPELDVRDPAVRLLVAKLLAEAEDADEPLRGTGYVLVGQHRRDGLRHARQPKLAAWPAAARPPGTGRSSARRRPGGTCGGTGGEGSTGPRVGSSASSQAAASSATRCSRSEAASDPSTSSCVPRSR